MRLVIMTKKRLFRMLWESRKDGYYDGIQSGYGLGKIAGEAEERNKGCILGPPATSECTEDMKKLLDNKGVQWQ